MDGGATTATDAIIRSCRHHVGERVVTNANLGIDECQDRGGLLGPRHEALRPIRELDFQRRLGRIARLRAEGLGHVDLFDRRDVGAAVVRASIAAVGRRRVRLAASIGLAADGGPVVAAAVGRCLGAARGSDED